MAQEQHKTCSEKTITEQEFVEAAQKLHAWKTATDFMQLIANSCRPEVVFVTEGYVKQQPLALNYQLPEPARVADSEVQPAPPLFWSVTANMLNPARLLSRELSGCLSKGFCGKQQHQQPAAWAQHELTPFGVVERCKMLDVQYISKQYMPQEQEQNDNPFGEHQEHQTQQPIALTLRITLQRLVDTQQQLLQQVQQEHRRCEQASLQETACCSRVHSPESEEQQQEQLLQFERSNDGAAQQSCNDKQALICSLEYPVLHLEGYDFMVPAVVFDQGMADWSQLAPKDEFTMEWDGVPCEGFVEGYRRRKLDDPHWGSPWRSIIIDWKEEPLDRETAPEEWAFGNPWEMQRLPHYATARAVAAPWTKEGAAVAVGIERARAAAAAKKARQAHKRKRASNWGFDNGYDYDAGTVDDGSEPSDTSFFFDDDPEDYIIHHDSRRGTQRRRSQQQRSMSAPGGSSTQRHSRAGAATVRLRGGEAGDTEPAHNWGRELVGVPGDVCLVCRKGSEKGELVRMHTGKAQQNCCRRYHVGCLLLLNAAGLRTAYLGKQQLKRRQQQGCSAGSSAAAAVPGSGASSDGLLRELQQLLQQPDNGVSAGLAAAVAEAETAAALYTKDELSLACPAHFCHGCGLNGKHEFLVWCCCCWVRTYHCRNCMPRGAEYVTLSGRDYIRCPYCVAANATLPLQPPVAPVARPLAARVQEVNREEQQVGGPPRVSNSIAAAPAFITWDTSEGAATAAEGLELITAAGGQQQADPAAGAEEATEALEMHDTATAAAAAAAAAIQEELMQQQQLLLSGSWNIASVPAAEESMQLVRQQHEHEVEQQQQLDDGLNSHVHTPDAYHIVSHDPEQHEPPARAAAAAAAAASASSMDGANASAAAETAYQFADGQLQKLMLLPEVQELRALQREIEALQQQLCLKQQLYQRKQKQLERKHRQLLEQHGHELATTAAAAATSCAAGGRGRIGATALSEINTAVPYAAGAAVPAAASDLDVLSSLDVLSGAAENAAEAAEAAHVTAAAVQDDKTTAYTAAAAAAAQAPGEDSIAGLPSWLQLSLEDDELRNPSWKLVPVGDDSGTAAEALRYVADAIARLPHAQQLLPHYSASSAAAAGSWGEASCVENTVLGLPLCAPCCHWLIGSREKAEAAKYKVSGSWAGCPVIHVETPDESVFGVCFVTDHAARFRIRQQEQQEEGSDIGSPAAGEAETAALVRQAAQQRPDVYLRCWKPVAPDGRQRRRQQQRQRQDGEEQGSRRGLRGEEWEVAVNGRVFPAGIGREGLKLQEGDVVTVQGVQLRLTTGSRHLA